MALNHLPYKYQVRKSILNGEFCLRNGKTTLVDRFHQSPLKISKTHPFENSSQLYVCVMDCSPGMLDGDEYDIHMNFGEQTEVYLTNQAYTKIHPSQNLGVKINQRYDVKIGALLEYFPEPMVPFAKSCFQGETTFQLEKDASLVTADILTPGRIHLGESFDYQSFNNTLKVYRDDKLIAWDRFHLNPSNHHFRTEGSFGEYTHMGSFWIFSKYVDDELLKRIRDGIEELPNIFAGASFTSEQGICVRILGHKAWELQQCTENLWNIWREHAYMGAAPLIRK
ncbi:urease accessory protein UreD [Chengkuizengella axinellae]|uniref:Urease accessory protein UreD n=1 Tax=Chengkuizengella axinellae TaxID=3064388 RepID=A0ABT9IX74_9BACL|nr:urease accessory protein UreD [Chengkuizengella sp. 2205SS18-9]MDP5273952.1 urease accessory protein UreD [Chengkuizengella sp. 2205SS18-9]